MKWTTWLAFAGILSLPLAAPAGPTTYDGKHDLSTIALTVVYFVPKDRKPLPDWKDRAKYFVRRLDRFHDRELDGQSQLKITLHPDPLKTQLPTANFRRGDGDQTFFSTMDEVKRLLPWTPDRKAGYPILLVLSDINWRELDDFRRVRTVDGQEVHEGNRSRDGRHFPGAESGGARATYIPDPGYGMGLVSGDGWRVPYSGSDCVVYHEGLGHTIGLPHPDPADDSVMGTGQYAHWINECYLNLKQKERLGWKKPETIPDRSHDLFTHFRALQNPIQPKTKQEVALDLTWPKEAKVRSLRVRVQTGLFDKWDEIAVDQKPTAPARVVVKAFDRPTPVSYRVDAELTDGQKAECWGYFQVK